MGGGDDCPMYGGARGVPIERFLDGRKSWIDEAERRARVRCLTCRKRFVELGTYPGIILAEGAD